MRILTIEWLLFNFVDLVINKYELYYELVRKVKDMFVWSWIFLRTRLINKDTLRFKNHKFHSMWSNWLSYFEQFGFGFKSILSQIIFQLNFFFFSNVWMVLSQIWRIVFGWFEFSLIMEIIKIRIFYGKGRIGLVYYHSW